MAGFRRMPAQVCVNYYKNVIGFFTMKIRILPILLVLAFLLAPTVQFSGNDPVNEKSSQLNKGNRNSFGLGMSMIYYNPLLGNDPVNEKTSQLNRDYTALFVLVGIGMLYNNWLEKILEEQALFRESAFPEMVAFRMEKGADPLIRNEHRQTPLIHAVIRNKFESVLAIVDGAEQRSGQLGPQFQRLYMDTLLHAMDNAHENCMDKAKWLKRNSFEQGQEIEQFLLKKEAQYSMPLLIKHNTEG